MLARKRRTELTNLPKGRVLSFLKEIFRKKFLRKGKRVRKHLGGKQNVEVRGRTLQPHTTGLGGGGGTSTLNRKCFQGERQIWKEKGDILKPCHLTYSQRKIKKERG